MIIKERLESDYVQIPNTLAQHRGLSFFARGMLVYILSKPADWVVQEKDLMNEGNCGRDRVRKAVKELLEAGYLTRYTKRAVGRFSGVEYVAHQRSQPSPEKPSTEKPTPVKPTHTKERSIHKKEYTKDSTGMDLEIDKTENGMSEMIDELDADDFGMWWAAYPRQVNEKNARTAYYAASKKVDRATLLRAAEGYAKEVRGRAKEYITLPARFLTDEMWQDYDLSKREEYTMYNGEVRQLTSTEAETAKEWIYKKGRVK